MDEKNEFEKFDDVVLPGFRFHPTDEELVGFYLKRKIQQKPLPIELIKQVDIYKYDPWDLPKLATMGEKEWYFYCPRDRKYRNSTRPNRVTGAGFWKATGTDRPIYSSDASKCIGLKKSLVFYRGRAAKGVKTDWMMHEFRLPSLTDSQQSLKKQLDKDLPSNDGWAICRIFKKTNSMAQRALSQSQSWVSPLPESNPLSGTAPSSDIFSQTAHFTNLSRENSISCTTETGPTPSLKLFCSNNSSQQLQHHQPFSSNPHTLLPSSFMSQMFGFSYPVKYTNSNCTTNINIAEASFINGAVISNEHTFNSGLGETLPQEIQSIRSNIGFPFSLPEAWKTNDLQWESSQCPSEMSATSYSPNH